MLKTDFSYEELRNFEVKTLVVSSASLKGNPLKDSFKRYNQVLVPKTKKTNLFEIKLKKTKARHTTTIIRKKMMGLRGGTTTS